MKYIINTLLIVICMSSLTSCMKEYECRCPAGTELTMKAMTKKEAREGCEAISLGDCTL